MLVNAAVQHFLDRWQAGQAIDVPKVIHVLLSAEALHMTSAPVFVDGGQLIETHRRFVVPLLANAQGYAGTILSDTELFIAWRLNGGLVQLRPNASTSRALWVTLVISVMRVARTEGEMSSQRGLPSSSYGIWGVSLTRPDHEDGDVGIQGTPDACFGQIVGYHFDGGSSRGDHNLSVMLSERCDFAMDESSAPFAVTTCLLHIVRRHR